MSCSPPYIGESLARVNRGRIKEGFLWGRLNSGLSAPSIRFPTRELVYCFKRGAGRWWQWCVCVCVVYIQWVLGRPG